MKSKDRLDRGSQKSKVRMTGNHSQYLTYLTFLDIRLNDENDDCGDTIRVPESTGTSTSIFSPNSRQFHMCPKCLASMVEFPEIS